MASVVGGLYERPVRPDHAFQPQARFAATAGFAGRSGGDSRPRRGERRGPGSDPDARHRPADCRQPQSAAGRPGLRCRRRGHQRLFPVRQPAVPGLAGQPVPRRQGRGAGCGRRALAYRYPEQGPAPGQQHCRYRRQRRVRPAHRAQQAPGVDPGDVAAVDPDQPIVDDSEPPPVVVQDTPPVIYDTQPQVVYDYPPPVYVYTPYPVVAFGPWVPFVPFFGFGFFYHNYHPYFSPPRVVVNNHYYGHGGWNGGGWHGGPGPGNGWHGGNGGNNGGWHGNPGGNNGGGWHGGGNNGG